MRSKNFIKKKFFEISDCVKINHFGTNFLYKKKYRIVFVKMYCCIEWTDNFMDHTDCHYTKVKRRLSGRWPGRISLITSKSVPTRPERE